MKKLLSVFLAITIICACIPFLPAAAAYQEYQGSRYYYSILASRDYANQRQAIYNLLASEAEKLHSDFTTNYSDNVYLTIDLEDYFSKNSYGNFDLDVYDAADQTVAAFFHDNSQYFFLSTNISYGLNIWEYKISFLQPEPTDAFPSLDFRNAADRRLIRDMVDSTFSIYSELISNAGSKYEIARMVYDKIASDWDYSTDTFSPGAHTLIGALGYAADGIVCEAYAKMLDFLLNNLGVPTIYVAGHMIASGGYPSGGHAWNIVKMDDNKYYFVDLTWADNQRTSLDVGNYRNPINHEWFLLGIDSGKFEDKHYAGAGSFVGVYERPANMGGQDYDYKNIHSSITFLTDLSADRSQEFNLGTYHLPESGSLNIQPKYYDESLVFGTDYIIEFEEPLHLGKNRVWFKGIGDYSGLDFGVVNLVEQGFKIDLEIELQTDRYEYTGTAIEPVPIVKNGSVILEEGTDYTVSYQNNIDRGIASVVITGIGMYAGTYTKNFNIIIFSNGTEITAAEFDLLYPTLKNYILVIKKMENFRASIVSHNNSIPNIQDAANIYGLPVYYIDYYESDPTGYAFYDDMLDKFYESGEYSGIELFPFVGIFGQEDFGVYAAEALLTEGGYSTYPFFHAINIPAEIEKYINTVIDPPGAEVPVITANPSDKTVMIGSNAVLTVTASVLSGTLSYQWYEASSKASIGTAIQGQTSNVFSPPTTEAGVKYYYCVVTNTDLTVEGNKTASATSPAVSVTVEGSSDEFAIIDINISQDYTFTAQTVGEAQDVKYYFYVIGGGSVHYKELESMENSFTYKPESSGNYSVRIYAIDNTGRKVFLAKNFTV